MVIFIKGKYSYGYESLKFGIQASLKGGIIEK